MKKNSTWLNFDPDTYNFQIVARKRHAQNLHQNFDAKMSSMNASNDPGEAIKVYVRVRQLLGREEVNKIEWKVDDERSISSKNGAKK